MQRKVLLIGGYGKVGRYCAHALAASGVAMVIAGRSREKAEAFVQELKRQYPKAEILADSIDAASPASLSEVLALHAPLVILHTAAYEEKVVNACIAAGIHYIDTSADRKAVPAIHKKDAEALEKNVLVVSGASLQPCITGAVLDAHREYFDRIEEVRIQVFLGREALPGGEGLRLLLEKAGRRLDIFAGCKAQVYGWQHVRVQRGLSGEYWLQSTVDVPELDMFPAHYGIGAMASSIGLPPLLHLFLSTCAALRRLGWKTLLNRPPAKLLELLEKAGRAGYDNSSIQLLINGRKKSGNACAVEWSLEAKGADMYAACAMPAVLLVKHIISGKEEKRGAYPCIKLLEYKEIMKSLAPFAIKEHVKKYVI